MILNFNNYKNSVSVQFLFRIESRLKMVVIKKMVVIRIRISNIFIRLSFTYFYEIKTLSRLLFLDFKICNGAKQNSCENICTLTFSKDFLVYLFFIKNLVKVHCIHCHPRIKCSSNIYNFPPSLPKMV